MAVMGIGGPMQLYFTSNLCHVIEQQLLWIDVSHQRAKTVPEQPELIRVRNVCCPSAKLGFFAGMCEKEGDSGNEGFTQREGQEELWWQGLCTEPPRWLDSGQNSSSFRHNRSKEALGRSILSKSAGVNSQLVILDSQLRARMMLPSTSERDASDWTVAGYGGDFGMGIWSRLCEEGELTESVAVLTNQVERGFHVDSSLFYSVLKRCIAQKDLVSGRLIHALTVQGGYESDTFLSNHLIRMYTSHGKLQEALQVFARVTSPDTYMWASIILAYSDHGQPMRAISLYRQLCQSALKPNSHIFVAVLKACSSAVDLASGKQVHADILRSPMEPDNVFVGSCLVDMYAKCGSLEDARRVFDRLPRRDVVTWTAMIAGYAQLGLGEEALTLFARMQQEGITPVSRATFVCLLKACASVGALSQGVQLHSQIRQIGLEADVVVGNCLVDMYAKCGRLKDAREAFEMVPARDVVTWTALLNAYAEHSNWEMAMQCYNDMRKQGVEPDNATFTCLLVACSHGGLVNEGQKYFRMMVEDHGIAPDIYHYNCMVDLLGRSGHLDEAETILRTMPFENDVVGLTTLLSACKCHGDIERGTRCFELLVKTDPENATPYVLLASLYANANLWSDVQRVEALRKAAGARKKPARASIEIKRKVHTFVVGEERDDIAPKLRSVNRRLKEEGGHVPKTGLVLKSVSDGEKEDALCGHAEKLALAYGLLNTSDGATLLVTKNLRMCDDCHGGTKIMSRLERREIIVRDAHRVHRFVDGACSCRDRP